MQQRALALHELSQRGEQPRLHCGHVSVGIVAVQLSRRTGNLEQNRGVVLCSTGASVHEKLGRKRSVGPVATGATARSEDVQAVRRQRL